MRYWICLSLIFTSLLRASISEIYFFKEIEEEFEKASETTLVVFDVDDVLIRIAQGCLNLQDKEFFKKMLFEWGKSFSGSEQLEKIKDEFWVLPKRVLIELDIPERIHDLQKKGVKVIALTALPSGKFGKVEKIERWRLDQLESFGIYFKNSFPDMSPFYFEDLSSFQSVPLFEEGCLFAGECPKGAVLQAFLTWSRINPSKVIFIDDEKKNLESVKEALDFLQIPSLLYLYKGGERFKTEESAISSY